MKNLNKRLSLLLLLSTILMANPAHTAADKANNNTKQNAAAVNGAGPLSLTEAMKQAKANDLAVANVTYDIVIDVSTLTTMSLGETFYRLKNGINKTAKTMFLGGHNISLSITGDDGAATYPVKALGMNLITRNLYSLNLAVLSSCEEEARRAFSPNAMLRIYAKSVPHKALYKSEVELLTQYGWEYYRNQLLQSQKMKNFKAGLKKFVRSLDDAVVLRGSIPLELDKIAVSCERK